MLIGNNIFGLRGIFIDTPEFNQLRAVTEGAVVVQQGKIQDFGPYDVLRKKYEIQSIRWIDCQRFLVFPGLIDLHTHLPQYPAVARHESDLLPWLRQHIFPLERDFTSPKARKTIPYFFQELVRNGTTTAVIYSAIFEDTCNAAFEAAETMNFRAVIGKTMMDVGSYGNYQPRKVVSISLHESERLCQKWHGKNDGLLDYAFSPRFAVSCSEKLMREAAELAKTYNAYIQTHLSENLAEIDRVRNLFMWANSYTDVYAQCGLLGPKSILGHCIHLDDQEVATLASTQSAIAHCPTSNLFLGSGIAKLEKFIDAGIPIGLGTDVAGGPELNLWQVMRSCIESQKARGFYDPEAPKITPTQALYFATLGGARALGKGDIIGSFEIGKEADFTILDPLALLPDPQNSLQSVKNLSPQDLLSLAVYRGGPQAVISVYVRGRKIYQADEPTLF